MKELEEEKAASLYGTLYEGCHLAGISKYTRFLESLHIYLQIALAVNIRDPYTQSATFVVLNGAMCLWVILMRPYEGMIAHVCGIGNYGMLAFAGFVSAKISQRVSVSTVDFCGDIIYYSMIVTALANILGTVCGWAKDIYDWCKQQKEEAQAL